jgi:pilus assembly protein CpaD
MAKLGLNGSTRKGTGQGARSRRLLLCLLAAGGLAACDTTEEVRYAPNDLSVEQRYPIVLAEEPVVMELPVVPGSHALTAGQRAEVASFLRTYRSGASGPLVIRTPSGTRNETAALSAVEEIRRIMAEVDVSQSVIKFRPYSGSRGRGVYPPVILAYKGVKAVAAECGDWSVNIAANYENNPYPNYGCSSQHNLAAMVADPRDLDAPRPQDPPSAERRQTVREKYIAGEPTSSKALDENKGQVSEVGK